MSLSLASDTDNRSFRVLAASAVLEDGRQMIFGLLEPGLVGRGIVHRRRASNSRHSRCETPSCCTFPHCFSSS